MVISRGSFTFFPKKSLIEYLPISKMCNDGPSYRVGEASRASPKGLARLPNIYNSEMYQVFIFDSQVGLVGTGKEQDVHENMKFMQVMEISISF